MSASPATHAPIAVFAYNRRDLLEGLFSSLSCCNGFAESAITVFVDGPKGAADRADVYEVRAFVSGLRLPNLSYSFAEENRGLRNSVFTGVSRMIEEHGRVIVLEDDLVLSPIALDYFNAALTRYADCEQVWSIVGYAYDAPELRDVRRVQALPFAHPWGWATWERAWRKFDLNNRPADADLRAKAFRTAFDMNGLYPFSALLRNSIAGRVNSWFIHWYYTVFQHGGCSIFPPRRVLDNHGLSDGTHGSRLNPHDRLVKRPPLLTKVPEFTEASSIDFATLDLLKDSWELRVQRLIARAGAAKRRLKAGAGKPRATSSSTGLCR